MKNEKPSIHINLMGTLSFEMPDGRKITLSDVPEIRGVGKKQLAFLTYLILNSKQQIATADLIDIFWDDNGKDPYNSLRNTLHKTRQILKACFPEYEDMLILQHGELRWSDKLDLSLDVDRFQDAYIKARGTAPSSNIHWALEAYELYQGDVLPGASYEWLDSLNIYYRNIYIDLCKSLARQFVENRQWDETIRVCQRAYLLAPEIESFTTSMMYAMINMGQSETALRHYEAFKTFLWKEYHLSPSDEVESLRTLAGSSTANVEYEGEIIRQFSDPLDDRHSFECTVLIFRNLVQLELRNMVRNHNSSTILVMSMEGQQGRTVPSVEIQRLRRTILLGLRVGDPFTKLNNNTFMILLPGATEEQAYMVAERLKRAYTAAYSQPQAEITQRAYPLTVSR